MSRSRSSLYVFMPLAGSQLRTRRRMTARTMDCLNSSLRVARPILDKVLVHFHVNGPTSDADVKALHASIQMRSLPFLLTTDRVQDKVYAVNEGLVRARRWLADAFMTVDNDIYFRPNLTRMMLELFVSQEGRFPVGCEKLPLVPLRAGRFQREFSVFSEFVVRSRILENRRVTGSFYVIDPLRFTSFPMGCNEGDYLTQIGAVHSNGYVYSAYPADPRVEVLRRKRLAVAAGRTGFHREFQDPLIVSRWIEDPRAIRLMNRFQMWSYLPTFARIMLHETVYRHDYLSEIRSRAIDPFPLVRSTGIDIVRWIDPA